MHRTSIRAVVVAGLSAAMLVGGAAVLPPVASAAPANVTVSTSNLLLAPSAQDVGVGDINLVEAAPGDIPVGDVCIDIIGAAATWDSQDPIVDDNNTAATTSNPDVPSGVRAKFTVTAASTGTAATYIVRNLRLDTTATRGPITAKVGNCTGNNDQFEPVIKLGWIGEVDRIQGADRYVTAAQVAKGFPCTNNSHVVIARGDHFADALSASFLAGKRSAPILLVQPGAVPQATVAALKDLGASSVTIVGGESAISPAVATALDNQAAFPTCAGAATGTLTVTRVSGPDRYETAKAVGAAGATLTNPVAGAGTLGVVANDAVECGGAKRKTAIVASGENFPDALAAGGLAWAGAPAACGNESALPLLLTRKDALPSATSTALTSLGIEQVILVGGTAAVSTAVETAIDNVTGVSVVRVSGADRRATAVELTKRILGQDAPNGLDWIGGGPRRFFVVRGDDFADALAAGPLAGRDTAPVFLTLSLTDLGATSATGITAYPNADPFHRGTVVGGDAAVAPVVAVQVGQAIANQ